MKCKKCGLEKPIVNKWFQLCRDCNNERLHGSKYGKEHKHKNKINKNKILDDEEFYEKCFNASNHKCEECGTQLPKTFRDDYGKIVARWRYSHVVPKSIAPELRHDEKNINNLCLHCHEKWENGDKKSMKIFYKNLKNFPQYLSY